MEMKIPLVIKYSTESLPKGIDHRRGQTCQSLKTRLRNQIIDH